MASGKAKPPSPQIGLGFASPSLPPTSTLRSSEPPIEPSAADLDSFDDYDDLAPVDGVPRLRLADPPRDAPTVIVETVGDHFEVSRLRDNGTTVACVMWTRSELEELQRRIAAALELT